MVFFIFRFLLAFVLMLGWLMLLVRLLVSPFGLLVGWILLIVPLRRPLVWFRMWRLYLHFGVPFLGPQLMIFGLFGVVVLRKVYSGLIHELAVFRGRPGQEQL